jgi:hypothetical protein
MFTLDMTLCTSEPASSGVYSTLAPQQALGRVQRRPGSRDFPPLPPPSLNNSQPWRTKLTKVVISIRRHKFLQTIDV